MSQSNKDLNLIENLRQEVKNFVHLQLLFNMTELDQEEWTKNIRIHTMWTISFPHCSMKVHCTFVEILDRFLLDCFYHFVYR